MNQWRWARTHGRTLAMTGGFAEPDVLRAGLENARDAMICLVGAQMPLLEGIAGSDAFPGVTRVNFAGGRFPQEKLGRLREIFPAARVFNNYGCAEAIRASPCAPPRSRRCSHRPAPARHCGCARGRINSSSRAPTAPSSFVTDDGFRAVSDLDWTLRRSRRAPARRLLASARPRGEVFNECRRRSPADILSAAAARHPGETAAFREPDPPAKEDYVLVLAPPPDARRGSAPCSPFSATGCPGRTGPLRVEGPRRLRLANGKIDSPALKSIGPVIWRQPL
ncbi:MAG: hypothetical protein U1F87_05840 [Kiritimatiellia bacterium]